MKRRLTVEGGQGNRRNMRSMVADTLGKRSACSFENIIVLCMDACVLLVHARHTCGCDEAGSVGGWGWGLGVGGLGFGGWGLGFGVWGMYLKRP
jgi:hypothetical protein